jgi:hypothetical protein
MRNEYIVFVGKHVGEDSCYNCRATRFSGLRYLVVARLEDGRHGSWSVYLVHGAHRRQRHVVMCSRYRSRILLHDSTSGRQRDAHSWWDPQLSSIKQRMVTSTASSYTITALPQGVWNYNIVRSNEVCNSQCNQILWYSYKPEGRGFDNGCGNFLNVLNPSGLTRPWGLLSL